MARGGGKEGQREAARLGGPKSSDRRFRTRQHPEKAALLDTEQQLLLATHVVVNAGERHIGRGGEIPHRGGVIALVGEDLRRPREELVEALVVGTHGFERSFELST